MTPSSEHLRLTLTLPGSASLGAFQAGAVSALSLIISTLRDRGHKLSVDAIGGSSAGSIVGMLFGHCLLTGRDTARLMRGAWVDEIDVGLLQSGNRALLGFEELKKDFSEFLRDKDRFPTGSTKSLDGPLELQVGLTSLQGYIKSVSTEGAESASLTYADWAGFKLEPEGTVDALIEPDGRSVLDTVLASAAHPGAFAPRLVDRSDDADSYREDGIENFPDSGLLWYTDGGLVESRPIGRVLEAGRRIADGAEGQRLHLVIDPRSSGVSGNKQWSNTDTQKSWIDGLRRSLSILPTQALHDDLRQVATINERIARVDELLAILDGTDAASAFDGGRADLEQTLSRLANSDGKEVVTVEMITPLILTDQADEGVSDLLAGDFVGAFGGFLNQEVRRSDFNLGWKSTRAWAEQTLGTYGYDNDDVQSVLDVLDEHDEHNWADVTPDGDGIDQLSVLDRWRLASLALRAAGQLVGEALPMPSFGGDK